MRNTRGLAKFNSEMRAAGKGRMRRGGSKCASADDIARAVEQMRQLNCDHDMKLIPYPAIANWKCSKCGKLE